MLRIAYNFVKGEKENNIKCVARAVEVFRVGTVQSLVRLSLFKGVQEQKISTRKCRKRSKVQLVFVTVSWPYQIWIGRLKKGTMCSSVFFSNILLMLVACVSYWRILIKILFLYLFSNLNWKYFHVYFKNAHILGFSYKNIHIADILFLIIIKT